MNDDTTVILSNCNCISALSSGASRQHVTIVNNLVTSTATTKVFFFYFVSALNERERENKKERTRVKTPGSVEKKKCVWNWTPTSDFWTVEILEADWLIKCGIEKKGAGSAAAAAAM